MTDLVLASHIDRAGKLSIQIAALEVELKTVKAAIVAEVEPGTYEGDKFKVTVTKATMRDQLDMDAVRAHLSVQFITAHTTKVAVKPSVRVSARMDAVAA